jgi:hypothetical protein
VGLTTLPCKKKIVEKPPRNSAGFCGGGQGLSWAVEPRKEEEEEEWSQNISFVIIHMPKFQDSERVKLIGTTPLSTVCACSSVFHS